MSIHTAKIDETARALSVTCEDGADVAVAQMRGGWVAPAADDAKAPYAPSAGPLLVTCESHGVYLLLFQGLRRSASGAGAIASMFLPFPDFEWGSTTTVTFNLPPEEPSGENPPARP